MGIDYVYWIKVFAGVIYGFLSALVVTLLQEPPYTYLMLFLSVVVYIALAEVLWRASGMAMRRRQSYLNGVGGYAGVYLLTWFIFFNVVA